MTEEKQEMSYYNSMVGMYRIGWDTYACLQRVDRKGARKVVMDGFYYYKGKTRNGGRVWYVSGGSEALAETPAGPVYGSIMLDGEHDDTGFRAIFDALCVDKAEGRLFATLRRPNGYWEHWEFDDRAQAWRTLDGAEVFVPTNKGVVIGQALWMNNFRGF